MGVRKILRFSTQLLKSCLSRKDMAFPRLWSFDPLLGLLHQGSSSTAERSWECFRSLLGIQNWSKKSERMSVNSKRLEKHPKSMEKSSNAPKVQKPSQIF